MGVRTPSGLTAIGRMDVSYGTWTAFPSVNDRGGVSQARRRGITVKITGGARATPRGEQPRQNGQVKAHTSTVRCSTGLCIRLFLQRTLPALSDGCDDLLGLKIGVHRWDIER
jgi:hypothetical protein